MLEKMKENYYGLMAKAACAPATLRARAPKGQVLIEYSLLGALLAVGLIVATIALRTQIEAVFNAIKKAMADAISHGVPGGH